MSSSNIGARRGRNVRDHLLVINSILDEVSKEKSKTNIQILDVKSCFDKLWGSEASNDAFDNGLKNYHFLLPSNQGFYIYKYVHDMEINNNNNKACYK